MKKIALILVLCLLLSGCGAAEKPQETAAIAPPQETAAAETPQETAAAELQEDYDGLRFSTTDRSDNAYDESFFAAHTLTMINFWEPWCPPCVGEMPELEQLSRDYADRGFAILGVYSTPGMEDEVDAVLADTGVSYPILHYVEVFDQFQTGYVPTTILVDSEGHVVGESIIGSRDYAGWAELIEGLL